MPRRPSLDPSPHQRQQPVRIGNHVAEQPVHRLRRQGKRAIQALVYPRHCYDTVIEWRLEAAAAALKHEP